MAIISFHFQKRMLLDVIIAKIYQLHLESNICTHGKKDMRNSEYSVKFQIDRRGKTYITAQYQIYFSVGWED